MLPVEELAARAWPAPSCTRSPAGRRSWRGERAYLQVEADNPGAHAFWARAGFVRSHGYHYRVAPA